MKILKFGGKSLANGKGLASVVDIIESKAKNDERITVVLSARGDATDELISIMQLALENKSYKAQLESFKKYQTDVVKELDLSQEFATLDQLIEGIYLLKDCSSKIKDQILSQGEVISAKVVTELLKQRGVQAQFTDSRELFKTDESFGEAQPIEHISKDNVIKHFSKYNGNTIAVVTGFIGSNHRNETTTFGRNGSNYTASLLANYLEAEELQNYTHVDGIYSANPDVVDQAIKIERLSYAEANELAHFGAHILHPKTIIPLVEKEIPLRILNTFNANNKGTLITSKTNGKSIKSLSLIENMALINLEGRGLAGEVGIDARIFTTLANHKININMISQGSSERGIGFVVKNDQAEQARIVLEKEFERDLTDKNVTKITIQQEVDIISIIGQGLNSFHKPYNALIKNKIVPLLFNNTLNGANVSIAVHSKHTKRAINVIHGELFEASKKVNLAIFGHGLVGGALIDQLLQNQKEIEKRKGIKLRIFAIANSKKVILDKNGICLNWKSLLEEKGSGYTMDTIIEYARDHHLENLIAVDNTASVDFVENYITLIKNSFDLVSSNKIANTLSFESYKGLRNVLDKNQKQYLYETNVGAGLPLIDTIKLLHLSGENITRIKGVFSGSLSYIFNTFSTGKTKFSEVLKSAISKGYTEPDPREDLCGNDVARKLLILARELDLCNEFEDIKIENLIPKDLRDKDVNSFLENLEILDGTFEELKSKQKAGHVLRYVGDLSGDLSKEKGNLEVKLVSVPGDSSLGQVKGSDSIIEIFTESYGDQPIVIQGAGAGAAVTARGVFGDILRIANPLTRNQGIN